MQLTNLNQPKHRRLNEHSVAIKHIPSTADDLPVKGNNVDFDSVDFVLNEFDEQSIEQAVLVKEAVGGTVTVVGVDMIGELDGVLHLALAKGADKAVKITGDDPAADSHHASQMAVGSDQRHVAKYCLRGRAGFKRPRWSNRTDDCGTS
ncbi:hypothetical protein [Candidatus Villigracilis proximus]|uniref:hypothetical protein n=1 Tax=Candidatus Villigracilis proximus TaxID=3140683 RepID=UPI0031EDB490